MKNMTQLSKRKGVSPVIATVILVAVTITVAVAVAYWMSGIASQYTQFEKVEIQTAISTWDSTDLEWVIEIKVKNTGTTAATLTNVFINDVEVDAYTIDITARLSKAADGKAATDMTETEKIESGATATILVFIDGLGIGSDDPTPGTIQWKSVSSGTTVNIKIHSAAGMDYIRLVQLN